MKKTEYRINFYEDDDFALQIFEKALVQNESGIAIFHSFGLNLFDKKREKFAIDLLIQEKGTFIVDSDSELVCSFNVADLSDKIWSLLIRYFSYTYCYFLDEKMAVSDFNHAQKKRKWFQSELSAVIKVCERALYADVEHGVLVEYYS